MASTIEETSDPTPGSENSADFEGEQNQQPARIDKDLGAQPGGPKDNDGDNRSVGDEDGDDDASSEESRFLAKKRKLDRENRNLRKQRDDALAKLKEHENAQLSKEQRLERDVKEHEASVDEMRKENNRLRLQVQFPAIDDDLLAFIPDGDFEAMAEAAEKLLAKLNAPKKDAPPRKTPNPEKLRGGQTPDEDDPVGDPWTLVKSVPRF